MSAECPDSHIITINEEDISSLTPDSVVLNLSVQKHLSKKSFSKQQRREKNERLKKKEEEMKRQDALAAQLAEYREKKKNDRELEARKAAWKDFLTQPFTPAPPPGEEYTDDEEEEEEIVEPPKPTTRLGQGWAAFKSRLPMLPAPPQRIICSRPYRILLGWPGKVLLWLLLWWYFVIIEWGAIYFMGSLMIIMWRSMSAKKKTDAPSAYSVFNKDCERLPGTFTAEQFDNSLRTGMGLI